jgi:hypothetical protein
MSTVSKISLILESSWEPKQFDGRVIIRSSYYVSPRRAIECIDITATGDFWPYSLYVPPIDGREGGPLLIFVTVGTIWLNTLSALTRDLVV